MDKSYRIHTNINDDISLNVNMSQDFDFLEVLSLKLRQKDAYRLHSSSYGIIVGRVLANDAFGIPNAKISIFIERDGNDSSDMESIYPYAEVTSKDREGRRYNLLPDDSDDECYKVVGSFPNKRFVLDDDVQLDVYEKYWKYTTTTNNAGDYMLFGVPTGNVTVHVDIDLSDIGILSQKPRDFEYKGYNLTLFDSPSQFKDSTNLDDLAQIFSQNKSVYVNPFWGDIDNGIASLTRADIQIQYKFEPTCVFLGSIVSDNEGHAIGHECDVDVDNGMNDQLVGGSGTIEMIRKTTDGLVEEYPIKGNQLIDENGVWCYQIPMNLDYIGMDEYGNIVPTDNPNIGIPTRTQVRFRISKNEAGDEGFSMHTAKYLVPMNPIFDENRVIPTISERGIEVEKMYNFGSSTPLNCFRDLYWNNVYSVKNYIPKTQTARRAYSPNYSALKGSNLAGDLNPIPFNKLRIDIPFLYMIVCLIYQVIVWIVKILNVIISSLYYMATSPLFCIDVTGGIGSLFDADTSFCPFELLLDKLLGVGCVSLSAGDTEGEVAYYIWCWDETAFDNSDCPREMPDCIKRRTDEDELMDKIQRNLALEFKIVKLDLYQDWVNGCLYMPLWYWRKRKKKTFLFGLISIGAKNEYCSDVPNNGLYGKLKTNVTCNIGYNDNSLRADGSGMQEDEDGWHKYKAGTVYYNRGLIKPVENKDGLTAYYYVAVQATSENTNTKLEIKQRETPFSAITLYATDIILLGNLDEDNIYGIPQFFKCLPPTTSNVPPIATIEKEFENNKEDERVYNNENTDSGDTVITGMDWNNDGPNQTPAYKKGLFMDLACTYAATKGKSCINVERLSELGVSLDMVFNKSYRKGGKIEYADMDSDGFITKHELDDTENRAMFATLNHIGFMPQEYININPRISGTTQIYDSNTNYLIPKFKYLYPVDFDGRLQYPIENYKNQFLQQTYDVRDESYLTFRLGAESGETPDSNSESKIRHFYHVSNELYDMPLYNNSYYFYFGIKRGSTAIDKFNELFYADCVQKDKKPFTLSIEARGRSYCPETYDATTTCEENTPTVTYNADENRNAAYGYIRVSSDDIRMPYYYKLEDAYGNEVISESNMTVNEFVIGGILSGDTVLSNCNGRILEQRATLENGEEVHRRIDSSVIPYYESGLTNQNYVLEIIDADGNMLSEKVELEMPKIKADYETINLGTKFYNSAETRIDYICNDINQFYGEIKVNGISVDGQDCTLTRVTQNGYTEDNILSVCVDASSTTISDRIHAVFELSILDAADGMIKNCLCDKNNPIASAQNASSTININGAMQEAQCHIGFSGGVLTFYVYQPNSYAVTLTQACEGCDITNSENSSSDLLEVQNGEPFETYLNGMPTRFMIGTSNDSVNGYIVENNKNHFYYNNFVSGLTENSLLGWYGTHQENAYMFPETVGSEIKVWRQFLGDNQIVDINSLKSKKKILEYKFNKMFSLSEGVYFTYTSSRRLNYTATGGVSPILYRSLAPDYSENRVDAMVSKYAFSDYNSVTVSRYHPNIVSKNYTPSMAWNYDENKPALNPYWTVNGDDKLGVYFAAFTKNGGYVSSNKIDETIVFEKKPSFTQVLPTNPHRHFKRLGKVVKTPITDVTDIYSAVTNVSLPYLRSFTVDRRLDYELILFAPSLEKNFTLHTDEFKDALWKGGRISGQTFNGIEMSYDEEYNIISAEIHMGKDKKEGMPNDEEHTIVSGETNEEEGMYVSAVTPNNRLEYSYAYDGENNTNAITIYNSGDVNSIWEGDGDTGQIIKRFYSATMNGTDIRNLFWSTFNRNRLSEYISGITSGDIINGNTYVYKYPSDVSVVGRLYNGDFSMETVSSSTGNYPTMRFIDIANLQGDSYFNLEVTNCSYTMKVNNRDADAIKAITTEKRGINFETYYSDRIEILAPNADSNEYANVTYVESSITSGNKVIYYKSQDIDLIFKYSNFDGDELESYPMPPRAIKVLPYTEGYDGISYFKLSDNVSGECGAKKNLYDAISAVTIAEFGHPMYYNRVMYLNGLFGSIEYKNSVKYPDGVDLYENGGYIKNGKRLKSSDSDFSNIIYHITTGGVDAFTILSEKSFENGVKENLRKHIEYFETSEIFDCRYFKLKIDDNGTYIMMVLLDNHRYDAISSVSADTVTIEATVKGDTPPEGGDESTTTTEDANEGEETTSDDEEPSGDDEGGEGEETQDLEVVSSVTSTSTPIYDTTKSFIQVINFVMPLVIGGDVSGRTNEAFSELGLMSYMFTFRNSRGEEFDIKPQVSLSGETDGGRNTIILSVKWTENMGVIIDSQWGTNTAFRLTVKSKNNFTYKTVYHQFSSVYCSVAKDDMQNGVANPVDIKF